MRIASVVTAAGLVAGLARETVAQELRGTVRDSATHQPIAGAVLVLLDSSGAVLGRNITNDRGAYRVALTRAISRMQVLHIGFRPRTVGVPAIENGVAELDVTMVVIPAFLEPVRVTGQAKCPRRDDSDVAFALWEQAKTALLATVVARETNAYDRVVRLRYDRRLKDNGPEILSQSVLMDSVSTMRPFVAWRSAAEFVERGFMTDSAGRSLYAGPDADVLLDDAFVSGYCFRVADGDPTRPNEVGLAFTAAQHKRSRIDIEGAVWIDSTTRSLTQIAYRYVGVNPRIARYEPGGRIEFRTMLDGSAIIDRWSIRVVMPDTTGVSVAGILRGTKLETHEIGGEVAVVTWTDGRSWHNALGTLQGRLALDSPGGNSIRLIGTPYRATADSVGLFEIVNLLPGPYSIGVVDPRLVDLGILLKTGVSFTAMRDSTITALVEVPSAEQYMASVCEGDARAASSAGLAVRVNMPDGTPAVGAHLTVRLVKGGQIDRRVEGETDRQGLFHLCHAPHDAMLEIRAERPDGPAVVGARAVDAKLVTLVLQFKNAHPR